MEKNKGPKHAGREDGDNTFANGSHEVNHGCEVLDDSSGVGSTCGRLPVTEVTIGGEVRRVCAEHTGVAATAF